MHKSSVPVSAAVRAGEPLYRIDPTPYEAQPNSAPPPGARPRPRPTLPSRAQADRYKALLASNAVSKQASDNAVAAVALARLKIDTGGRPLLRTCATPATA